MATAEENAHFLADDVRNHELDDDQAIELAKVYAQLALVDAVDRLRVFLADAVGAEASSGVSGSEEPNPLEGKPS